MAQECTLSTGKLPPRGFPRNRVVRINDRPNMTSAVYCGCKAQSKPMKASCKNVCFDISVLQMDQPLVIIELHHEKTCFCICKNKGEDHLYYTRAADQHLSFCYIDSTILQLSKSEISSLLPSVVVQPGLCQAWSEIPKTNFLVTRLNSLIAIGSNLNQ